MAPTFVSGSSNFAASGGSVVVTAPSDIVPGNLLVAIGFSANASTTPIVRPSGLWVNAGFSTPDSFAGNAGVFYKTATASDVGASYTFTGPNTMSAIILQYSGAANIDGTPLFQTGTSATTTFPASSVLPAGGNTAPMWITAFCSFKPVTTGPTGFTARTTVNDGTTFQLSTWEQQLASSAATGTTSATASGNPTDFTSISFVLGPVVTQVAAGAVAQSGTSRTPTKIAKGVGNIVPLRMGYSGVNPCTGITGGGCEWHFVGWEPNATLGGGTEIWYGIVKTVTAGTTATIAFASAPAQFDQYSIEFDSGMGIAGAVKWITRAFAVNDHGASTAHPVVWPTMDPVAGDTIFGGSVDTAAGVVAGATPGAPYVWATDGNGDVGFYAASAPAGSVTPQDASTTSTEWITLAALFYPSNTSSVPTPDPPGRRSPASIPIAPTSLFWFDTPPSGPTTWTGTVELDVVTAVSLTPQVEHDATLELDVGVNVNLTLQSEDDATIALGVGVNVNLTPSVEHDATMTLGVGVSLALTPQLEHDATIALATATSIALTPLVTHQAIDALAVQTALALTPQVTYNATDALAVATVLNLTPSVEHDATLALAIATALNLTPLAERDGTIALAVACALALTPLAEHDATIAYAVATALALSPQVTYQTAVALAVATTLVLSPQVTYNETLALAVQTVLALSSSGTQNATIALAIQTALALTPQDTYQASIPLAIATALSLTPLAEHDAADALAIQTTLALSAQPTHPATLALAIATTLTAGGIVEHDEAIALAVATVLALTPNVEHDATLTLATVVTLALTPVATHQATIALAIQVALALIGSAHPAGRLLDVIRGPVISGAVLYAAGPTGSGALAYAAAGVVSGAVAYFAGPALDGDIT